MLFDIDLKNSPDDPNRDISLFGQFIDYCFKATNEKDKAKLDDHEINCYQALVKLSHACNNKSPPNFKKKVIGILNLMETCYYFSDWKFGIVSLTNLLNILIDLFLKGVITVHFYYEKGLINSIEEIRLGKLASQGYPLNYSYNKQLLENLPLDKYSIVFYIVVIHDGLSDAYQKKYHELNNKAGLCIFLALQHVKLYDNFNSNPINLKNFYKCKYKENNGNITLTDEDTFLFNIKNMIIDFELSCMNQVLSSLRELNVN